MATGLGNPESFVASIRGKMRCVASIRGVWPVSEGPQKFSEVYGAGAKSLNLTNLVNNNIRLI